MNVLSYIQYASFKLIPILASAGFATAVLEEVAKAVGAGMLVSGFVMAVLGLARGRPRGQIEKNSLRDACVGGLFAIGLIVLDLSMRYFV